MTPSPSSLRLAVLGRLGLPLAERAAAAGHSVRYAALVRGSLPQVHGAVLCFPTIEEAVRDAELVIDFVPDELESKLEILSLLDRMAPPAAILATPTQVLSIRDLASCTYRAEQVVALRLPAELPSAELEIGLEHPPETRAEVLAQVEAFWASLGASTTRLADLHPLP